MYKYLLSNVIRAAGPPRDTNDEEDLTDRPLTPIRCEEKSPEVDWPRSWRQARLRGLGPKLSSFSLQVLWGILPTRERLHRILPHLYPTTCCQLCGSEGQRVPETFLHSLGNCKGNHGLPTLLLDLLHRLQVDVTLHQVLTMHIEIDPNIELALVWTITSTLLSV